MQINRLGVRKVKHTPKMAFGLGLMHGSGIGVYIPPIVIMHISNLFATTKNINLQNI